MLKKILVPIAFVSLGVVSAGLYSTGCGDSGNGGSTGTGGAAGGAAGASGGAGGSATVWPTMASGCTDPFPQTPAPPVTTADFCAYYDAKCSATYGTDPSVFANRAGCESKYATFNDTQKRCAASRLCTAGTGIDSFCARAAGGPNNGCNL